MVRQTRVLLRGGLGNQLFQWSAGMYLADEHKHSVVFELPRLTQTNREFPTTLANRGLPGRFKDPSNPKNFSDRLPLKIRRQIFGLTTRGVPYVFKSPETGFDEKLKFVAPGQAVSGYFQSWKYTTLDGEPRFLATQLLRREGGTKWFAEHWDKARASRPVVISLRRGDYRSKRDGLGLIAFEYYKQAVEECNVNGSRDEVWIFSDEPDEAARLSKFLGISALIVKPPANSDPAESLVLMSEGSLHIIGNSSFSWWGAFLSQKAERIIAPRPWFRTYKLPQDLIPESWETKQAVFD